MSSDPKLIPYVLPLIDGVEILDIGCGNGKWGHLLRTDFWYTASGKKRRLLKRIIGLDLFLPYLLRAKMTKAYDDVVRADASSLPFRDGAFETTLILEVLEHLNKRNGLRLLLEAERVSRRSIILSVPFYATSLIRQGAKDDNPQQCHLSNWDKNELRKLGYHVIGHSIQQFLSTICYIIPQLNFVIPQFPFSLIAKKKLSDET